MSPDAPSRGLGVLLAGALALAFVRLRGEIPWVVALHRWMADRGVSDRVRHLDATVVLIALPVIVALVLTGGRLRAACRALGFGRPLADGLLVGVLASLPMLVVSAATGGALRFTPSLFEGAVLAPFVEELFFRGLLVALVVRAGGVGFWTAAIVSGVLFGASHVAWTAPPGPEALPIVLLTGAGGVFYAWLLRRWGWNLWVPILLHAGMNFAWMLFAVAPNAVGGLWANVGRAGTIAIAVLLTLRRTGPPPDAGSTAFA